MVFDIGDATDARRQNSSPRSPFSSTVLSGLIPYLALAESCDTLSCPLSPRRIYIYVLCSVGSSMDNAEIAPIYSVHNVHVSPYPCVDFPHFLSPFYSPWLSLYHPEAPSPTFPTVLPSLSLCSTQLIRTDRFAM